MGWCGVRTIYPRKVSRQRIRSTLTQANVYPREVVLRTLRHQASSVVLAHNHPSGQVAPSAATNTLTRTLPAALTLIDGARARSRHRRAGRVVLNGRARHVVTP